ncbi:MAG: large-conductance mechanosensitive channel protein MscL [Clostridiales bacterium]|nr:large-conductance mechanosensitive channel protein MscL [Clostridiales bacterium]MDY6117114.1 large-conductance mechanosensitive channel protein MscL [Anaerovoracaceae bacterium]
MKGFIKEFKEFISRGSVIDLAVAVVIGGAFTKIVNSLVDDIIMPIIGVIIGGINFEHLMITVGTAEIKYGMFIQTIVNFILISFVIFSIIKSINQFKKKEEEKPEEPAAPSEDIVLLTEIRDLLRK